ncbi:hypothetical protein PR202_ga11525 [Eleusine coracana subsp. coracana]|uniref:Late embryogenesis abundant protein LEA-2 subgroup domain-containing protein n=1 Tax=Eleusine coracana subsp. coracana TaxID=191504 RepID=A0AAV5C9U5_ELECO|nr:hypothetical protein PR202_ga11525 [Eleusine coracana subsp. coracana]
MYQRPIYRPQPAAKRRRGRSCRCSFCCCLCWLLLVLILLAFVAAVAGGAFYLLYRPQRPTFSVSAVRLAALNLTSSATAPALTSAVTLTITAKNPNKKVVYLYDDLALSAATAANGVPLGSATVPGFTHQAGNTTVISATLAANAVSVDPSGASSDIKKSGSMSVVLDAETRAGVRVGGIRTKKIGIQVHCEGIKVTVPAPPKKLVATKKLTTTKGTKGGKHNATAPAPAPAASHKHVAAAPAPAPAAAADDDTSAAATVSTTAAAHSCHVRVRVKIWRWTF